MTQCEAVLEFMRIYGEIRKIAQWFKNVITEFNDNPKDFVIHAVIVLIVVGAWGLIMGIMEEYR